MYKKKDIFKNIKNTYYNNKNILNPEPFYAKFFSLFMGICAILSVVLEIVYFATQLEFISIFFVVVIIIFVVTAIINCIIEMRLKKFHASKIEDINNLCMMVIDDEAKKYGVSKDELVIYLIKSHRIPWFLKCLSNLVLIIVTAIVVFYLPSYNHDEHGIIVFLVLLFTNIMISIAVSSINKKIYELDEFDFLIIKPYRKMFSSIDDKLKM